MYDVIYILHKDTKVHIIEPLKWSLRSIERNFDFPFRVTVAGYVPEWLSDKVKKVRIPDTSTVHRRDFDRKLYEVIDKADSLSDHIIVMYDDCYIMRPFVADELAMRRTKRGLRQRINDYSGSAIWRRAVANTVKQLERVCVGNISDFETHYPMYAETAELKNVLEWANNLKEQTCIASMYGNLVPKEKVIAVNGNAKMSTWNKRAAEEKEVLSSAPSYENDESFLNFMMERFPEKSIFEK